jgi:hypothetical protein
MAKIMTPLEAIETGNVWLTSFNEFIPETHGFLAFSVDWYRAKFLENAPAGTLTVVYGTKKGSADRKQAGQVIGVLQTSNEAAHSSEFMHPSNWEATLQNSVSTYKWLYAVKVVRAWHITEESYLPIEVFAPYSYTHSNPQLIGSRGVKLRQDEARKLLEFTVFEAMVYNEQRVTSSIPGKGANVWSPTKAGPVSQTGFFVKEAEGPKHLYILQLQGDIGNYLGRKAKGQSIIKVGFSGNPVSRLDAHNQAWPRGAFEWVMLYSTLAEGLEPWPKSKFAIGGEDEMKGYFQQVGTSLDGEFFLVDPSKIEAGWRRGKVTADALLSLHKKPSRTNLEP